MKQFSQYFFIFSKITTSLILLFLIIILIYALYTSYQNIDKASSNVENNILLLSQNIIKNKNKLDDIESSLILNQKSLKEFNKIILEFNQNTESVKNQNEIAELLKIVKNLKEEIYDLKINTQKKEIPLEASSDHNFKRESLVSLIIMKYKSSQNIEEELSLLQSTNTIKENVSIFEKLNILQSKNFIGIDKLNNDFIKSRNNYVKNNFLEKNRNIVINFLSNFVKIKPGNLNTYEDRNLNILLKVQNHLFAEEIDKSIKLIKSVEGNEIFFSEWVEQASLYSDFISEIKKLA